MGKALIQSSLGNGHYAIKVLFDNARVEAKKTALQTTLSDIDQRLESIEEDMIAAKQSLNDAWLLLNNAIQNQESFETLENYQKYAIAKRQHFDQVFARKKRLLLLKKSIEKEIVDLDRYAPSEIKTTAWCVAHNEDLSGETKVIEIDYAIKRDPSTDQIRNDTGFWIPATQEQSSPTPPPSFENLQHPLASSPQATWFNLCMLPAMQRDYPSYRVATITSIDTDTDTCTITLDGRYTADQFRDSLIDESPILPVVNGGQRQNFSAVSINYPPCNSEVFEVGDRVIFDVLNVEIIGFYSNPRKCVRKVFTGTFAFLNSGEPFSIGILPQTSGPRGPIASGEEKEDVIIYEPYDLGLMHLTNWSMSVSGSGMLTRQDIIHNGKVTLDWSQNIIYSCSGQATDRGFRFVGNNGIDVLYSIDGNVTNNTRIQTMLSVNGQSVGIVHECDMTDNIEIHSSHLSEQIADYSLDRVFTMIAKSLYVGEDGQVYGERQYACTGQKNFISPETISSQIDYIMTPIGIDDAPIIGSTNNWRSITHPIAMSQPLTGRVESYSHFYEIYV